MALVPGTYTLNFNYTDAAGNEALEVNRTVEVHGHDCPSNYSEWRRGDHP